MHKKAMALLLAALLCLALPSCQEQQPATGQTKQNTTSTQVDYAPTAYDGSPYVEVNNNVPDFPASDYTTTSFERYGKLDKLGRCTTAYANIGRDLMPTEKRGDISQIKPSGWHSVRYDCVEADYIKETGNHVLYRVTPIYNGDNLVADGVQMEARSVEDDGEGITYHVYCYNVQPGVGIDYATGESWLESTTSSSNSTQKDTKPVKQDTTKLTKYVLNTSTMKFHKPDCSGVEKMSKDNRRSVKAKRESLIQQGYSPCGQCKP